MGNKREWYPILVIGLALLLVSSVIGCAPSDTKEDIDATFQRGYTAGFEAGYEKGYETGLRDAPRNEERTYPAPMILMICE